MVSGRDADNVCGYAGCFFCLEEDTGTDYDTDYNADCGNQAVSFFELIFHYVFPYSFLIIYMALRKDLRFKRLGFGTGFCISA